MSMVLLSACGAPVSRPMPLAMSGPVAVVLNGQAYVADLEPVTEGARLTVTRDEGKFGYDQGRVAKAVAEQFCTNRGTQIYPRDLGPFMGGVGVF
jgi:hypothetical protein